MAHSSLKIVGGFIQNETPALNQTGIATGNLVRLKPDPNGLSLPEKLGGWTKFWSNQITNGPVRAIWCYQDTESRKWLIYGTDNISGSQLGAVECFTNATTGITAAAAGGQIITPQYQSDSVLVNFQTTAGSNVVTVTDDTVTGVTQYDVAYLTTPVAVGGLVLQGMYPISQVIISQNSYQIVATDVLGNPTPAAFSTVAAPLVVTGGSFTSGTPNKVTLDWASPSYTFAVGDVVTVNNVTPSTVNGTWIVLSSTSTSVTFATGLSSFSWSSGGYLTNYGTVPIFNTTANSTTVTAYFPNHGQMVGGNPFYVLNETIINGMTLYGEYPIISVPNTYTFTFNGPSQATSTSWQFQNATAVTGGSANGTDVTLQFSTSIFAVPTIAVTGGTGSGTSVTLTWSEPAYEFIVGQTVLVDNMVPSSWNGAYVITGSTSTSVTYANTTSGSLVSGGTVTNPQFDLGAYVWVSGVTPTDWNGWYVVTGVSDNTVSYANASSSTAWVTGGSISDNGGDEAFIYSIGPGPYVAGSGYGVGGYGVGGYGTGQTQPVISGISIGTNTWLLDNWGNQALALPVNSLAIAYPDFSIAFQPVYYWDPTSGQIAARAIPSGPSASNGMFVAMPQRQIIAWGSTFSGIIDPLLVRWCDVNDYTVWIAQITNQAGSYRLPSGGEIRGGLQTPQQGLLWTDIELWSMQYIGQPYVYSFNKIGQGCGLIAKWAKVYCSLNGIVYWMGSQQFFSLSGYGVQPIVCPIWDVVFQQLDLAALYKITCAANSLFQEITWYYPVQGGTGEVQNYVRYNVILGTWDFGMLGRSAWTDVSVMGPPIGADPVAGYIYQHETSPDADGQPMNSTFTTGYFALSDGDQKIYIDEVWPDMKWGTYGGTATANVQITFNVTDFPGQTPATYGPYTVTQQTQWINPRMRGRLMSITLSSGDLGSFWRLGLPRYRIQPDGRY